MRIFAIYGSTRRNGNSELLTDIITNGLDCTRIYLSDYNIQPIVDQRYEPGGFQPIYGDHPQLVKEMLKHDMIIFAMPLYWFGMPGSVKNFIDRWTMFFDDGMFRERMSGKEVIAVITGCDNPRLKALTVIQQLHWICDFMDMTFFDYVIGQGNDPGEVRQDQDAISKAEQLNHILRARSRQSDSPAPPMAPARHGEQNQDSTEHVVTQRRERKPGMFRDILVRKNGESLPFSTK